MVSGSTTEAFAEFVGQHQGGIRAFVRSLGVYPDAVDDLAQEVFLVAWKEMDRFDQEYSFGGWLRGIARNLVMNERRKGARRSRILSSNLTEILDTNYPEHEVLEEDAPGLTGIVKSCIGELPERSRFIIDERYGKEKPLKDISAELKNSEIAIRQAISRIRQVLRKCIEAKSKGLAHEFV